MIIDKNKDTNKNTNKESDLAAKNDKADNVAYKKQQYKMIIYIVMAIIIIVGLLILPKYGEYVMLFHFVRYGIWFLLAMLLILYTIVPRVKNVKKGIENKELAGSQFVGLLAFLILAIYSLAMISLGIMDVMNGENKEILTGCVGIKTTTGAKYRHTNYKIKGDSGTELKEFKVNGIDGATWNTIANGVSQVEIIYYPLTKSVKKVTVLSSEPNSVQASDPVVNNAKDEIKQQTEMNEDSKYSVGKLTIKELMDDGDPLSGALDPDSGRSYSKKIYLYYDEELIGIDLYNLSGLSVATCDETIDSEGILNIKITLTDKKGEVKSIVYKKDGSGQTGWGSVKE